MTIKQELAELRGVMDESPEVAAEWKRGTDRLARVLALVEAARAVRADGADRTYNGHCVEPCVWERLVAAINDMREAGDI